LHEPAKTLHDADNALHGRDKSLHDADNSLHSVQQFLQAHVATYRRGVRIKMMKANRFQSSTKI
jgi:hypothetical protein